MSQRLRKNERCSDCAYSCYQKSRNVRLNSTHVAPSTHLIFSLVSFLVSLSHDGANLNRVDRRPQRSMTTDNRKQNRGDHRPQNRPEAAKPSVSFTLNNDQLPGESYQECGVVESSTVDYNTHPHKTQFTERTINQIHSPMNNKMILSCRSSMPCDDDALAVTNTAKPADVWARQSPQLQRSLWIKGNYDALPEIPLLYPIEKTNCVVQCSDPHVIADRILRCLQKLSITATFNQIDASLRAETIDHTEFHIRLYKHVHINSREIMVEVQRSNGESFNYIKYANVILAAAKGELDMDLESEVRKRSSSASLSYIPGSISCHHQQPVNSSKTEASTVDHAKELIQKDRVDARLLGLNSLLLLTDFNRSLVSSSAAKVVLQTDENGDSQIKDFIYNLVRSSSSNKPSSPREVHMFASREEEIMHNTALAVLGNSVESMLESNHSKLTNLVKTEEWTDKAGIVDVLLSELSNDQNRLHDAYQASRSISLLLESSSEMKQVLLDRNVASMLKDAQLIGNSKHSLLAAECKDALALISGDENIPPFDRACEYANSFLHWPCY